VHDKFKVVYPSIIEGATVWVCDDSIFRGDQSNVLVRVLRELGVARIVYVSTAPPAVGPCFYGVALPHRKRLIAHDRELSEVKEMIGCDYLNYLSIEAFYKVMGHRNFCMACFNGKYPIPIPEDREEIGHVA
jgi:amidophosphoribosyltransferase